MPLIRFSKLRTQVFSNLPKIAAKVTAALLVVLLGNSAFAADPAIFATNKGAIRGVDVVSYFSLAPEAKAVKGSPEITHDYMGATFRFASEENRELFIADPEKYVPQYGGYCAFAVSHGFTKPVDPNRWSIVDGKLYVNLNGTAERKWLKNRDAAIERGNANWPTVLTACEERGNCAKPPKR